jgi:hypothetical protein
MYSAASDTQSQSIFALLTGLNATLEASMDSFPSLRLTKYIIQLDEICHSGRIFKLNFPVSIELSESEEGGGWEVKNEELASLTFGPTREEAVDSFCEDFAFLWDEIANVPDEELEPDALRAKAFLRSLVQTSRGGR